MWQRSNKVVFPGPRVHHCIMPAIGRTVTQSAWVLRLGRGEHLMSCCWATPRAVSVDVSVISGDIHSPWMTVGKGSKCRVILVMVVLCDYDTSSLVMNLFQRFKAVQAVNITGSFGMGRRAVW
jgi:hypothetical protein